MDEQTQGPEVHGELETHLTVACPAEHLERLAAWAAARGLGFTHIVLARGRTPSQPMLNDRGRGSARAQAEEAGRLATDLAADGFRVVRTKVEAAPWAAGVPQDDAAGAAQPAGRYFEHHVKLLLSPGWGEDREGREDRAGLERLCLRHGAHLSWNARRVREDGRQERFVTQRCQGVGRVTAERRLSALLDALGTAAYEILEVEREFVVHDSNLGLDEGWLTGPDRRGMADGERGVR